MRSATTCVLLLLSVAVYAFEMPRFDLPEAVLQNQHSVRAASNSCPVYTYTCVAQGGNCNYSSSTPNQVPICFDGQCGDNGLCPVVPKLGQACTEDCVVGLECSLVSRTCVPSSTIGQPGAACEGDAQCTFTNSSGTYSVCEDGICLGVSLGEACSLSSECSFGFCKKGVCSPLMSAGGYCYSSESCSPGTTCNRNKCVPIGSVKRTKLCTEDDACADGLSCNDKSKRCTPKTYSGACNSDSDCKVSKYCTCDLSSSPSNSLTTCYAEPVNPTGSAKINSAFGTCTAQNKCASVNCLEQKCRTSYCAFREFVLDEYFPTSGSNCLYAYYRQAFGEYVYPAGPCSS